MRILWEKSRNLAIPRVGSPQIVQHKFSLPFTFFNYFLYFFLSDDSVAQKNIGDSSIASHVVFFLVSFLFLHIPHSISHPIHYPQYFHHPQVQGDDDYHLSPFRPNIPESLGQHIWVVYISVDKAVNTSFSWFIRVEKL